MLTSSPPMILPLRRGAAAFKCVLGAAIFKKGLEKIELVYLVCLVCKCNCFICNRDDLEILFNMNFLFLNEVLLSEKRKEEIEWKDWLIFIPSIAFCFIIMSSKVRVTSLNLSQMKSIGKTISRVHSVIVLDKTGSIDNSRTLYLSFVNY